jgi:hypothetical protein
MDTNDTALRLNKHGKPFVRQGFSQLIHTMREAFKACQAKSVPCLIHLEFRDDAQGQGGIFEVLSKPTRTGENCTALVRRQDGVSESFTLAWTPANENEITWNRRKANKTHQEPVVQAETRPDGERAMELIQEFLDSDIEPVKAPEELTIEEAPEPVCEVPKMDRIAMLKAAHARTQAARAASHAA